MKINFVSTNRNLKTASYRIWVHDLSITMIDLKHDVKICDTIKDIETDADVVILCKSCFKLAEQIKRKLNNVLVGAINVPGDYHSNFIDFVIVGSIEEYTSMGYYKNVFIYPLIERKFEKLAVKSHNNEKETFNILFHGNYPHLFKFEPFLKSAIEKFNTEKKKVVLKVITSNKNFNWVVGKPNVDVQMYDYDEKFVNIAQSCDICVVPNVSDIRLFVKDIVNVTSVEYGLYNTDYFLRMKNKTNSGRAYVGYQLGLPVVHDLCPSSLELLSKSKHVFCCHDEKSYFKEFEKLLDSELRNTIAKDNKIMFEKHYDPHKHAEKLIENIRKINE